MSTSIRQSELFAGADWTVLYRAFTQINFNATDPSSINQALRDYLRTNYPEDFNDWIESSEFVAIVDLLSWLAGTLAFKVDINARENFLETANARESILRLARFLSYNPSRNRAATGLVKLDQISSDDDLTDANGRSLAGRIVQWNNTDDPDWYENFTSILNAAFVPTNPFGTPLKAGTVGGISSELYRVNCRAGDNSFSFNANVDGDSYDFEVCNGDFDDNGIYQERTPDPNSAFQMFWRNDGNGNDSADTGFFLLFKQGGMQSQVFTINNPVQNQILNINTDGVTEEDVWVQTITDAGFILTNWTKVPAIFSQNITFNTLPPSEKDVFSVITRDNDNVSIRFSDGIFGTAPVGNIAVWYRIASGNLFVIKPLDINRISLNMTYLNRRGVSKNLQMVFSNYSTVSNSTPRETEAQIKRRAPSVYSTQSRMVSGEDYNVFPLTSNLATKLKAVNRVYAGHSRHIDMNDPTSTYQDVHVFSDDGAIYSESANIYEEVPTSLNLSSTEIAEQHLQPILQQTEVSAYVLSVLVPRSMNQNDPLKVIPPIGTWNQATTAKFSSTGWFSTANTNFVGGANILFQKPDTTTVWVAIASITGTMTASPAAGSKGPVTLAESVPTGSTMLAVIPAYLPELPISLKSTIEHQIDLGLSFNLWYDPLSATWLSLNFSPLLTNDTPPTSYPSAIKIMTAEATGGILWKLSARGTRMIFESMRKVKWYEDGTKVVDTLTGASKIDTVAILGTNVDINDTHGYPLKTPSVFNAVKMYYYQNGTHEPRRVQVIFTDDDDDGAVDNPDAYVRLISTDLTKTLLFWQIGEAFGFSSYLPLYAVVVVQTPTDFSALQIGNYAVGTILYRYDTDAFYISDGTLWNIQDRRDFKTAMGRGPNIAATWINNTVVTTNVVDSLFFHWTHYASTDHRIDPANTNIIDIFVLSAEYDYLTRTWIANGADPSILPAAPTELDLRLTFSSFEEFKMFSDEIVWRPVTYKFLFGNGSEAQKLRVKFKVVKLPTTTVADGEVKSRVITAINQFFDVTRWDFGETFYFTELAAFVHQQLATIIGSFVIVPQDEEAEFGDVFEVSAQPDEIFISTAQVSDVEIIASNTAANLRMR